MLKTLRALLLGATLAASAALPAGAQAIAPAQKAEFEKLIREYLLRNPEVLQEALVELDRRQREAEMVARQSVLKDQAGPLYASKFNAVAGNPNGDVTLVEFFDYNCGYCKRGLTDLQKLIREDNKLKVVLKDLPILSPASREAAAVALAVKTMVKPEQFWDYHTRLMAKTGQIGKQQALEVATAIGLDKAKVEDELNRTPVAEAFDETRKLADGLNMTGTPAYVLADDVVIGAVGYDQLKARIANVRKCGKNVCD
mgnify:CR=1 FL=1